MEENLKVLEIKENESKNIKKESNKSEEERIKEYEDTLGY